MKHVRHIENLKSNIRKKSAQIENLRAENEMAKNATIAMIKRDSQSDFIEKAEYFLELLLTTEKVIEVLRHDFNEMVLSLSEEHLKAEQQKFMEKILLIENDILKIGNLLEDVKTAIAKYDRKYPNVS